MLLLLLALAAPALQMRCLEREDAASCDRWIVALGRDATPLQLRRACAFEAPWACARWAEVTRDPLLRARALITACRVDDRACAQLVHASDDPAVPAAERRRAEAALQSACRRWPSTCYDVGRRALSRGDVTTARQHLARGCQGQDPRACGELAWRLERGDELPKDLAAARRFGDLGCRHGDARLCFHRLRQRQDAGDHAGIAAACHQGDPLSCAAQDARRCRSGDPKACTRVATSPPGSCPAEAGRCTTEVHPLPPRTGPPCPQTDRCAHDRAAQTRALHAGLRAAVHACGTTTRATVELHLARSGDVYRAVVHPPEPCLARTAAALRAPPSEAPAVARARLIAGGEHPRVALQVRARPGPPLPPSPPLRLGR